MTPMLEQCGSSWVCVYLSINIKYTQHHAFRDVAWCISQILLLEMRLACKTAAEHMMRLEPCERKNTKLIYELFSSLYYYNRQEFSFVAKNVYSKYLQNFPWQPKKLNCVCLWNVCSKCNICIRVPSYYDDADGDNNVREYTTTASSQHAFVAQLTSGTAHEKRS